MELQQNYLSNEDYYFRFESVMAKLSQVSEIAKMYYTQNTLYLVNLDPAHHFTTTGRYGILHNDSEYMMGFDSNYIMWYEGTYDGMMDMMFPTCYNCIYLYGVTSTGIQGLVLAFSTHPYTREASVVKVGPEVDIRRVDYIAKGQYTLLSDTEPTLTERFVIVKKGTDEVIDDIDGCCAKSAEKAIRHYNYVKSQNKQ